MNISVLKEIVKTGGRNIPPILGLADGKLTQNSLLHLMNAKDSIKYIRKNSSSLSEGQKLYFLQNIIFSETTSHEECAEAEEILGFFDDCPTRCWNCGSYDLDNNNIHDGYLVIEISVNCSLCKKQVGYWDYGYWDR